MSDINYSDLPQKTTASVPGDFVIITDSEDGDIVKIQDATLFKGPEGDPGTPGIPGTPGADAPEVEYEFSIDGATLWHSTFTTGDFYQRISTDGGTTWSNAIKFVGEDGTGSGDMLKSENLSGLTDYATARSNLGLNTTANQTDSTDKRFMSDAQETKLEGIEAGAEVNNISDVNATDLTDGGDTTLHTHDGRYYTETEVDNFAVKLTGDQTIAGIKTFSSFPVTPSSAPTTDYQVANKKYVDDNAGGSGGDWLLTNPVNTNAKNVFYCGAGYTLTTASVTINKLYYIPFTPKNDITLSSIGFYTGGGQTGKIGRIGIYSVTNDIPDSLLSSTGDLTLDTSGFKSEANTTTLSAGTKYFIGVAWNVATVGTQMIRYQYSQNCGLGFIVTNGNTVTHYYETLSGGWTALPSTAGTLTSGENTDIPAIFFM